METLLVTKQFKWQKKRNCCITHAEALFMKTLLIFIYKTF